MKGKKGVVQKKRLSKKFRDIEQKKVELTAKSAK